MKFSTKGGLKLDVNEQRALAKAKDILDGVAQHSPAPKVVSDAMRGSEAIKDVLAALVPSTESKDEKPAE